jgi:hypothetical protein
VLAVVVVGADQRNCGQGYGPKRASAATYRRKLIGRACRDCTLLDGVRISVLPSIASSGRAKGGVRGADFRPVDGDNRHGVGRLVPSGGVLDLQDALTVKQAVRLL